MKLDFEWWGLFWPMWGLPGTTSFASFSSDHGGGVLRRWCVIGPLWVRKILWQT